MTASTAQSEPRVRIGPDRSAQFWILGYLASTILAVGLGIGFFVYEGIFAPLSDAAAVLLAIALGGVVLHINRLGEGDRGRATTYWLGLTTVLLILVGSGGLVVGWAIGIDAFSGLFLGLQFLGMAVHGAWFIGVATMSTRHAQIRARTAYAAALAGVGMLLGIGTLVTAYSLGGFHPVVYAPLAGYAIGVVLWTIFMVADLRPAGGTRSMTRGAAKPKA